MTQSFLNDYTHNIYVTNQSAEKVYVCIRRVRIGYVTNTFDSQITDILARDENQTQTNPGLNSFLAKWGFCMIPPQNTVMMSFTCAADESGNSVVQLWASLFARSTIWLMDYEVNYLNFGCLFVKNTSSPGSDDQALCLIQANPEPVWIPARKGDALPTNIIKAGSEATGADYCGRSILSTPCRVTSTEGQCGIWIPGDTGKIAECGQLLQDTGHQWFRAFSGDPVPPNAVIVNVSDSEGSRYLGRVGGGEPCSIGAENGKIKEFCYFWLGEEKRVKNGELLVLTNSANPH